MLTSKFIKTDAVKITGNVFVFTLSLSLHLSLARPALISVLLSGRLLVFGFDSVLKRNEYFSRQRNEGFHLLWLCLFCCSHTHTPDVDLDSIFKRLFFCCFYFKIKSQLSETFSWTKRSFLEAIKFARSGLIWQTVFKYCSRFNSGFRRQFPRHRQRGSWGATEQRMTTARLFFFVLWRISLI